MAGANWPASIESYHHFDNITNSTLICPPYLTDPQSSGWVWSSFGECVTNLRQWFAFWIGMSSILCWLVAQVPQLIKNCRTGKADEALSFWFLLQWFLGDATNLIGSILSRQLPTQIATAVYFVIIDTITMVQYLFYLVRNQGLRGLISCCRPRPTSLAALLPGVAFTVFLASQHQLWGGNPYQASRPRLGRTLQEAEPIDFHDVVGRDAQEVIGYILGIISAMFYVMSRVPQIIKNCRRCSVAGLSPIMFILAVLGNTTYGLGIFLYSVDPVFLLQKLPWLVGSVGTLFFDATIIIQFVVSMCSKRCKGPYEGDREPLIQHGSDSESYTRKGSSVQSDSGPPPYSPTKKNKMNLEGGHDVYY